MAGDTKYANCPLVRSARSTQVDLDLMSFACENHDVIKWNSHSNNQIQERIMPTIEQMNQRIKAAEKKTAELKRKRGVEIVRLQQQQQKEKYSAIQIWGIALEQKIKNENDVNKRNESYIYLKSAMTEMTTKTKKEQKNITVAIEILDQLMTEAEPAAQEKPSHD
jgi:hypothetical protein